MCCEERRSLEAMASGWTRRHFLETVGTGAALLTVASWMDLAAQRPLQRCSAAPDLLSVSKKAGGAQITDFKCEECICGSHNILTVSFRVKWLLDVNKPCDETEAHISPGSTLEGVVTHWIRRAGPCKLPIGYFGQTSTFNLVDPKGTLLGQTTHLMGNLGFDSRAGAPSEKRCCNFPRGSGVLWLAGVDGSMKGCNLKATFETFVQLSEGGDPCKPWKDWTLWIDGVMDCPCR